MLAARHWAVKRLADMIRVDPYFLYQVGAAVHPLVDLTSGVTKGEVRLHLWGAAHWIDAAVNKSVYGLRMCHASGNALLETIRTLQKELERPTSAQLSVPLEPWVHYELTSQAQAFETIFGAEMQLGQLYLVQPKGGYDLAQLTSGGLALFPADMPTKVPGTIHDAREASRWIAFDLPTAAAFHLHRMNEIVLRRYYDIVAPGKAHPEGAQRTIKGYIQAMKSHQVADKIVCGALATLANLHRNPVLHPEQKLDSVEEAIALLGSINAAVTYMLKTIAPAPLQLTASPSEALSALSGQTNGQ